MLKVVSGDLFKADVELLVCPVNTMGIMGNGLALAFKLKFPWFFREYRKACLAGELKPGGILPIPPFVCVTVKDKFWNASKLEWVDEGLGNLKAYALEFGYTSLALPALGCGYGQLGRDSVKDLVVKHFENEDDLLVVYYENFQKEN